MKDQEQHIEVKEPSSFKLVASLGIAGFLSGLILVSTFLFTKPYIERNRAEALKKAVFEVLPGTSEFQILQWDGETFKQPEEGQKSTENQVYLGLDSLGELTGIAVPGEASGYQDIIMALAGYDPEQEVIIGLKVLESKETPGLGDKIMLDDEFQLNFEALEVKPQISMVKKGQKDSAHQIEAITGATISSNAIGALLQESMEVWKERMDAYWKTVKDRKDD